MNRIEFTKITKVEIFNAEDLSGNDVEKYFLHFKIGKSEDHVVPVSFKKVEPMLLRLHGFGESGQREVSNTEAWAITTWAVDI